MADDDDEAEEDDVVDDNELAAVGHFQSNCWNAAPNGCWYDEKEEVISRKDDSNAN